MKSCTSPIKTSTQNLVCSQHQIHTVHTYKRSGRDIMVVPHLCCVYVVCNVLCLAKPVTCVVSFVSSVPCFTITAANLYCDGLGQGLTLAPSESLTSWCWNQSQQKMASLSRWFVLPDDFTHQAISVCGILFAGYCVWLKQFCSTHCGIFGSKVFGITSFFKSARKCLLASPTIGNCSVCLFCCFVWLFICCCFLLLSQALL